MLSLKFILESITDKNNLFKSLKNNDIDGAKKAITDLMRNKRTHFTPEQELGVEKSQFKKLTQALSIGDINSAKEAIGVSGEYQKKDPFTTDPKTGKSWSIKPQSMSQSQSMLSTDETQELSDLITKHGKGEVVKFAEDVLDDFIGHGNKYDLKNLGKGKVDNQDFKNFDNFIQMNFDNKNIPTEKRKILQQITHKFWSTFQKEFGLDASDMEVLDLI